MLDPLELKIVIYSKKNIHDTAYEISYGFWLTFKYCEPDFSAHTGPVIAPTI